MLSFDKHTDRKGTFSQKWDKYKGQDILPMWVADTDFEVPEAIRKALHERVDHGIFGYTKPPAQLTQVIVERLAKLYQWEVKPEWVVYLPGLVPGLNLACRSLISKEQRVISPKPIYPPFMSAPRLSERELLTIPMKENGDRWVMDLDELAKQLRENELQGSLLLFCNPHNPGGTVYTREELLALGKLCEVFDLIVCSDEIHCDLLLEPGLKHIPFASLSAELGERTVTLMAPSKTFNIAGLGCSFALIPNATLRQKFEHAGRGILPDVSLLALTAAEAAYREGDAWLEDQLNYLRRNRDYCIERINKMPGLSLKPIEATYLAWIDATDTGLENPQKFFEEHGVGLSPGQDFGNPRYVRLNFGCTFHTLKEGLDRMESALKNHN
ncbi:MalY/PatB family protein [Pokkaliibacter sp. CJK22405]|uniref:MalY/PatB family protein n=1 Tax=Pokkaliibacter sp. CJK22405 TaxID=3384615 RepID=UPI0039847341